MHLFTTFSSPAKTYFPPRRYLILLAAALILLEWLTPALVQADLRTTATWSDTQGEASTGVAWADCDNDGDLDLAVSNDGQANRVYRNNGDFTLSSIWSSPQVAESAAIAWGDYDGDGDPDLAVGNGYGQANQLYRNAGNCTFSLAWSATESDWTTSLAWSDYDEDGDPDLVVGNDNQPNRLYRNDAGALTLAWSSPESDRTTSVAWGDYDGDGDPDLAVGNDGQPNRLYRNVSGVFTLLWSSAESDWTTSLDWGDYDKDGDPDLAVGNASQRDRLYRNDAGVLTLAWSAPISDNTSALAWGDWDADKDVDLAIAIRGQANRVYANEGGVLTSAWRSNEVDYSTALAWGNCDGDPEMELAFANWLAPNRVYDDIGHPDLSGEGTRKWVNKTIARPGERLRYTVRMHNSGNGTASAAQITDTLPSLVTWADSLSVVPDSGSYGYDPASRTLTWTGDIAAGDVIVISYQVTIANGLPDGTLITNTAWADDGEGEITVTPPVTTLIGPVVYPPGITTSATCSQSLTIPVTVTLGQHAVPQADVVFIFDRTGSMNDVADEVIANATDIMNDVAMQVGNAAFGAGYFADYAGSFSGCGYSGSYGGDSDVPWQVLSDVTTDIASVAAAMSGMPRMSGGDEPESYSRALWETLPGQGQVSWRPGSKRIVVLLGDSAPHDCTFCGYSTGPDPGLDLAVGTLDDLVYTDVVADLVSEGISVFAIAYHPGSCAGDAFDYVAAQTGGARHDADEIAQVPQAIVDLITGAVAQADLSVQVDPSSYAGWVGVSPAVYYDVSAQESRIFQVALHAPLGSADGLHEFDLVALADGAEVGRSAVAMTLDGCWNQSVPTLDKVVNRAEASLGDTLDYTITLHNYGGGDMLGVTVSDTLPAEVDGPFNAFASSGTLTETPGLLLWSGDVAAGAQVVITYQVVIEAVLYDGTLIANTAYLDEYGLGSYPPAETVVLAPELRFSRKLVSHLVAEAGDPITYTLLLQNTGHVDASGVHVTDTLPSGVVWDDTLGSSSGTVFFAGGVITWTGDIAAGQRVTITYHALLDAGLASGALVTNTAMIDDGLFPPFETWPARTVVGRCDVTGDKYAQPTAVDLGNEVTVNLVLTASCTVSVTQSADVVLALDRSGSMRETKIESAKAAAQAFVQRMTLPPDQVGLVSFEQDATLDQPLTEDAITVQAAIAALEAGGGTDIAAGITQAQQELTSPRHNPLNTPVIVLLTDGDADDVAARAAANEAKAAHTLLFTIGLGEDADHGLLQELASEPGYYFYAPGGAELDAIYANIAQVIGNLVGSDLIISDTLASGISLAPDSFTGPLMPTLHSADTLVWNSPALPPTRFDLSYRVAPQHCGLSALNALALAHYRDLNGNPATFTFPEPRANVICGNVIGSKQVDQAEAQAGDLLTYIIVLTGTSGTTALGVTLTDVLPSEVTWSGVLNTSYGAAGHDDGVITWQGTVPDGVPVIISYQVRVNPGLPGGAIISNTAQFDDGAGHVYTTFPVNTRVLAPNLISYKEVNRERVSRGDTLTYTLVLINDGGVDAVNARLTDTLPSSVRPLGTPQASQGDVSTDGGVLTWLGTVSTTTPVTITFAVSVSQNPESEFIINTALADDGNGKITSAGPVTTTIRGIHFVYLPLFLKQFVGPPDLVVTGMHFEPDISVSVTQPLTISVVVANVGESAVLGPFWVDLYVDCNATAQMPPGPNKTWPELGCEHGVAWLVSEDNTPGVLPLAPGMTVTLDSNHYPTGGRWTDWPGYFSWAGEHVLYAKADVYNGDIPYAAILESDEENNVWGPVVFLVSGVVTSSHSLPLDHDVAPRPRPDEVPRP